MSQFTEDQRLARTGQAARDEGEGQAQRPGDGGAGPVGMTRGMLREAIVATEDVGSGLVDGVSHLARDIVRGARDIAGELTLVARDGASGLIGAAGAVGGTAIHTATGLLVDVVGGVRQVVGAAAGRLRTESDSAAPATAERGAAPERASYQDRPLRPGHERYEAPV